MYEIDEAQIRQWWQVFNPHGKVVEIRLLGKATYSGYFVDVDTLIDRMKPLLDHANVQYYGYMQAYFTLNEVNDDLYSREQHDTFVKKPKSTTTDGDITRRRMVLIDLDPARSAGISASDAEYHHAHLKAVAIYRYLMEQGFKEPIVTTSGNGYHVYLPCDMPNDDEHNDLIKRFLQALGAMFSDASVEIDEKVYNPARIDKLIGTWAKKGSDTTERPWRIARILKVPEDTTANEDALFGKIAALAPKEEPRTAPNRRPAQMQGQFDIRAWLDKYNIAYREKTQGASTKFELQHCPWEDTHSSKKEWESALFLAPDGQLTFSCFHAHCRNRTWFDFRQFYEPDAYNKPVYQPQYQPRQYPPQKPKYEIKEEIPELGEKWLSMSSIKKIDLSALEGVRTGITELDRCLQKLYYTEVTILTGGNASGKSSFINTLVCNFLEQDVPTALWTGELIAPIQKTWIQMVAAGKNNLRLSQFNDGKYYVPDNIGNRIDAWMDGKFFLYNNEYGNTWEQIFHDMKLLVDVGVKMFILDNLFSLNIDLLEGDKNNRQKELIIQIKNFAKKHRVHIILVAHPRKTMAFMRKNDISGSGDLTNCVDDILIMHRVNNDFFRAGADYFGNAEIQRYQGFGNVIEVVKNRMWGVVDLLIGLHYEIESRRFKNTVAENVHYGWEREPTQTSIPFQTDIDEQFPIGAPTDEVPF